MCFISCADSSWRSSGVGEMVPLAVALATANGASGFSLPITRSV
ncbi:Uncharacterised protein [Mycobacteroides abscessus subsp. abscessus]|nr:Uncharacterised protein [Mycobacteroides abscessus subsp. abscessus]